MTDSQVLEIGQQAFILATKLAGPVLMASLFVGVVVSVLQTITQIQEMTLTFVPKLIAAGLILVLGGHWMISELTAWVIALWGLIPGVG